MVPQLCPGPRLQPRLSLGLQLALSERGPLSLALCSPITLVCGPGWPLWGPGGALEESCLETTCRHAQTCAKSLGAIIGGWGAQDIQAGL